MSASGEARGASEPSSGRRPGLDGIRGVAILVVALFHFSDGYHPSTELGEGLKAVLAGGWGGVDLFFALSGYLITGILWKTKGGDGYLLSFYGRRMLRILPLYYGGLTVLIFWITQIDALRIDESRALVESQGWYWGHVVNGLLIARGRWSAAPYGTEHLWSLSIEEQFYLVWPWIVMVCGRKALGGACLGALTLSVVLRWALLLARVEGFTIYLLTPARLDGLALGSWVAMVALDPDGRRLLRRWSRWVAAAAATVVVAIWVARERLDAADPPVQGIALVMIALTAASIVAECATNPGGLLVRALQARPLLFLGRYSYAIYVFHFPVSVALSRAGFDVSALGRRLGSESLGLAAFVALAGGVSVIASLLSWHLAERWFLRLKDRFFPLSFRAPAPAPSGDAT